MAAQERHTSPPKTANVVPLGHSTGRQSQSPLRQRTFGRPSMLSDLSNPPRDRRSSNFSDSIDSTRQSLKSSTDDLLLPRARSLDLMAGHEQSHWHSIPLALALLPAVGGLFFKNGSVVVTDLTLLALVAVFLNWAVRIPWDWYLSAQSVRTEDSQETFDDYPSDTIIEEGSEEEGQGAGSSPANPDAGKSPQEPPKSSPARTSAAAAELRTHEMLGLVACFVSPAIGAWLLHHIRSQLSRPSEGLVSNYNLTIFLLASEVRPVSHLIKMVQARTLHLQRTVATNSSTGDVNNISPAGLQDLAARVTDLETHIADNTSNGPSSKSPLADLLAQTHKSIQPDFDALNRAVRRYEKRATLLSLQTESRFQELEKRLGDAITLAAAAERSSQSNRQRRGSSVSLVIDSISTMALLPLHIGLTIVSLPGQALGWAFGYVEGYFGQKIRKEMKTAGKAETRSSSGNEKRRVMGRGQKKAL